MEASASFTAMADSTKEDWELIDSYTDEFVKTMPDRILASVELLGQHTAGMQVTRLEHSLQSATRAHRDGLDEEYVVAALVHDIGDELAPWTHGQMTAAIMRPYIREELCWIVEHHPVFQEYYYAHLIGGDRNARDRWKDHPLYDACAEFCEKYDQNCFDPAYDSLPLEFFRPMVERVFSEARYLDELRA